MTDMKRKSEKQEELPTPAAPDRQLEPIKLLSLGHVRDQAMHQRANTDDVIATLEQEQRWHEKRLTEIAGTLAFLRAL